LRYEDGAAVGLHALFPSANALTEAPLETIGVMRARADAIRSLARAVVEGRVHFRPEQTLAAFGESLVALQGIGSWTAQYVAMRALGQPDAFPAADLILRRAAGSGTTLSTRAVETMGEDWRPWRAYAVMLLWRSQG
jgi:AraC family transcriptional regulator of adaptative response / DNA-3-methyladenine glycosylase II